MSTPALTPEPTPLSDTALLDQIDALSPGDREKWHLTMFGAYRSLRDVAAMRIGEHAVHTWDVAVALDAGATVAPDAVELLIDNLTDLVARAGKPLDQDIRVRVTTHHPDRKFVLVIDADGVALSASGLDDEGEAPALTLSAEAFVRLVYGRLDPGHTPALTTTAIDIDTLRRVFPGV